MKTILIAIIVCLSFNAEARVKMVSPDLLPDDQKTQLIQVLNQMTPEMLSSLLSEEAMQWYIEQFHRETGRGNELIEEIEHSRIPSLENPYQDPNAPTWN